MRDALDRALGETPPAFCRRMDATLLSLKEERQVKKVALRTVAAVALMLALACSTAYALISQGLAWYYENRFTAYQHYEPEKHDAILRNMESAVPQSPADDPEIRIMVTETSWSPEHRLLVVSLAAEALDPGVALYPMGNLDQDGAYVGAGGDPAPAADGEDRAVHWLWAQPGRFGPVEEMTGGKPLLLLTACEVWWEDMRLLGDGSSYDTYVDENGVTRCVMHIELQDAALRQALAEDADGVFTLRIPYAVTPYTEDDALLYGGGRAGEILFDVQLK